MKSKFLKTPIKPIVHFWLHVHHAAHCAENIVSAWVLCQQNGCKGGGGSDHLQGAVHMVAVRLGCERAMVGTGWATSCPDCMDRLRKHYSHLVGGSFLA